MKISIPAETLPGELRVAATPDTIKKYVSLGHSVAVQSGAGVAAGVTDAAYSAAGASIVNAAEAFAGELVLKVRAPSEAELGQLKAGSAVLALCNPYRNNLLGQYAQAGITLFAMELLPRITRAQSMDVLSSQANIAGYKAVLMAANHYPRYFPMLMTAAGTVKAARVLILGAGVAGLQAIATAKRLGAVVEAFDVRTAAKEQVESLGAKFVEVPGEAGDAAGGYAKEMSDDYKRKQGELVHERAQQADIVISTALIPGRPAPRLIHAPTVAAMKPGSVIVDLATEAGGNVEGSVADQVVNLNGVTVIGYTNLPSQLAADASALYARNLLNFLSPMFGKDGSFSINSDDEIIKASLIVREGQVLFAAK
ncbi:Re/Si-specific NAD(P)(+) transhydrogenase subunit alpha [Permianibacter sp. IMCC34836]|uniref:Re/Si-specific NAD(P)(+) transhydrogenase subunit alpha n=1 Tax=Permianibacter fluminis TaxID=2738515 RepID=UPI00155524CB|nr:Re/Si-specific NAD(P)(+) transhydrogenase subunit alpha [Permianibacter fluminis]NQD35793.1 Re/Si-specific NAD(P)(+) transhydrogenase subunit alpha [Permianibacter fluminis]